MSCNDLICIYLDYLLPEPPPDVPEEDPEEPEDDPDEDDPPEYDDPDEIELLPEL